MRPFLALFVLGFALNGPARAQAPVEIADGRQAWDATDMSGWANEAPVREAVAEARRYWQAQEPGYEEDVRVFSVAEGAFTTPGVQQHAVLVLLSPWPRCCPKMALAVVEDGRLVRTVAFSLTAQHVTAVPALAGDGRDALALVGAFGMGGQESRSVTLAAFEGERLVSRGSTSLYDGACGALRDGESAARIVAEAGPVFFAERFEKPRCEDTAWQPRGERERIALTPPDGDGGIVVLGRTADEASAEPGVRIERGRLEAGDETLNSGEYLDEYLIEGRQGQRLVVDLRATEFDPYLIVSVPDSDQLDNDDHEDDPTRSYVETRLRATGTSRVIVTSYAVGETGAYELTIRLDD